MSRILRRPMFRGGRVSSYGTGIASGLADGGRVGFYRGGSGSYDPTHNKQGMVLGSDLINFIDQNPKLGGLEYFDTLNPKQYYKPTTYGGSRRGPQITDSPEFLKLFQNYMDPDSAIIDQDSVSGTVEYPIGKGGEASEGEISTNKGGTSNVENSAENAENNPGENIDLTNTDDDPTDVGEKDLESMISRYEKILGGKKAFGQDVSDMLLGFAGAKGDTVMEKFQDFAATEAKKGPSRTEKIDEAAATIMLKDKLGARSDRRKIDLMKSEVDYKISAGKKLSIGEGVLASTKGTSFSDKKLAGAIQVSTSDNTGERYKFKGVTDKAGLQANITNGNLKAGDTLIVKETIKVKGQPDKVMKSIVEVVMKDGKLDIQEVYKVT